MTAWRWAAGAAALAGYALLSHWLMVHAAQLPWAVAALFGPLLAGIALMAWTRRQWLTLAACAALVALLAWIVVHGGVRDIQLMYFLQHAGIHVALAWSFALTLRPGSTPLITLLAAPLHRRFTPALAAYTRRLTAVWVGYFVVMLLVSTALYLLAPWPWWSAYCNLATPLAVATLFVGEHLWRYRRHPEFERIPLRAALQAWRSSQGTAAR